MSSGISFSGLASGLDTGAIVDALIGVERAPLRRVESRRAEAEERRSTFQEFNTLLLDLRNAARDLDNLATTYPKYAFANAPPENPGDPPGPFVLPGASLDEEFLRYKGESSEEGVIAIKSVESATPGNFNVNVTSLASVSRDLSVGFTEGQDISEITGTGTLSIAFAGETPGSFDINVDATMKLVGLKSAINTDPANNGSVVADIIKVSDTEFRLAISSRETGVANQVTVSDAGLAGFLDPDPDLQQAATDATFSFAGLTLTRAANEVSDAIPGVSFEIKTVGTTEINISRDDEAIAEQVQALVDSYNAVVDFIDQNSSFDVENGTSGALFGDTTARSVLSNVQQALVTGYTTKDGTPAAPGEDPVPVVYSLGRIGITFGSDGRLSLDASELTEALDEDITSVRSLFGLTLDADNELEAPGLASSLIRSLDPVVRSGDGILASLGASLTSEISGFDDQIVLLEARLASREDTLRRRFAAMESLVSRLQNQASFLSTL